VRGLTTVPQHILIAKEVGNDRSMKRKQLLKKLDTAWAEFKESYAGLSESQMTGARIRNDWTVKDILAHVTTWEAEALKHLPLIVVGETPPRYSTRYGGLDAFNDLMTGRKRDLSLAEVTRQLDETHRRLIDYLQQIPEEQIAQATRFRHRLRLDTYSHYPLHTKMIREWRERSAG